MSIRTSHKAGKAILRLATEGVHRNDFDVCKAGVARRLLIDIRELAPGKLLLRASASDDHQ